MGIPVEDLENLPDSPEKGLNCEVLVAMLGKDPVPCEGRALHDSKWPGRVTVLYTDGPYAGGLGRYGPSFVHLS